MFSMMWGLRGIICPCPSLPGEGAMSKLIPEGLTRNTRSDGGGRCVFRQKEQHVQNPGAREEHLMFENWLLVFMEQGDKGWRGQLGPAVSRGTYKTGVGELVCLAGDSFSRGVTW